MVPSLPIFCLMVDGIVFNLHFSCGVVALEVGEVIPRIPEAPFYSSHCPDFLFLFAFISELQQHYLSSFLKRNEAGKGSG